MAREHSVTRAGVRLAVREWPGPGSSVLLIHGLASTSHIFDLLAPRLAREYRVAAYDQRGHGESGKPGSGYGFEPLAADAAAVIQKMRLGPTLVVGHSWGANVALEVGLRHRRRVSGLILIDGGFTTLSDLMDWPQAREVMTPPDLKGMHVDRFMGMVREHLEGSGVRWTPRIEAILASLTRVDRSGGIRPRLALRNHLKIIRAMWEQDTLPLLEKVRVPTLVLAARRRDLGPEDAMFVEAKHMGEVAIRSIGEPVRFEWIEGIHDVVLQRPEAVARRIRKFIEEQTGARGRRPRRLASKPTTR